VACTGYPVENQFNRVSNDVTFHSAGYDDPCWDIGVSAPNYLAGKENGTYAWFDYDYQHHNGYGGGEIVVDFGEEITTTSTGSVKVKTKNPYTGGYTGLFKQSGVIYKSTNAVDFYQVDTGTWWASDGWGSDMEIGALAILGSLVQGVLLLVQ
jgi:hypothetical protein